MINAIQLKFCQVICRKRQRVHEEKFFFPFSFPAPKPLNHLRLSISTERNVSSSLDNDVTYESDKNQKLQRDLLEQK